MHDNYDIQPQYSIEEKDFSTNAINPALATIPSINFSFNCKVFLIRNCLLQMDMDS
jgi:hypothetical protein